MIRRRPLAPIILFIGVLLGASSAEAQAPAPCFSDPAVGPSNLQATVTGNQVLLTWQGGTTITAGGVSFNGVTEPILGAVNQYQTTKPAGTYAVTLFLAYGGAPQIYCSNAISVTVVAQGPVPPGVPGAIQANVNGQTLTLQWGAAAGNVLGYQLEAGSAAGASNIGSVQLAETAIVVPGVPPGTYFLRVHAIGPGGLSAPTADVSVTVFNGCAPPSAPQGFQGSATGNLISLQWQPPGTGSGPISYFVGAGTGPQLNNIAIVPMGAALAVQGAVPAGVYHLRVAAVNACGAAISPDIVVPVP